MEINKAEADMEFKIAQHKIHERDFLGARRSALKSKTMNHEQEGMEMLLEVLNVLVYARKDSDGECDWYGILGVDPADSEEVIRKSHKRKLLALHPDKNKMPGAAEAMHLVHEAGNLLRDKERRAAYDWDRRERQLYQETPGTDANTGPSVPFPDGTFNFMFRENAGNTGGSFPFAGSSSGNMFRENPANTSGSVPLAGSSFGNKFRENASNTSGSVPFATSSFGNMFRENTADTNTSSLFTSNGFNEMFHKNAVHTSGSVPLASSNFDDMFNQNAENLAMPSPAATSQRPAQKPQTEKGSNSRPNPKPKDRKEPSASNPSPQPRRYTKRFRFEKARPAKPDTFWTICTNCRMRYEYDSIFKNAKLACPGCKMLFPAIEITSPRKIYKRKQTASQDKRKSSKSAGSQNVPSSSPAFNIAKPQMPPIFATPITIVPGNPTVHSLFGMPNTESTQRAREDMEAVFLGQWVSRKGISIQEPSENEGTLQTDPGTDSNVTKNARDKGKNVITEEPSRKKGTFSLWK